MSVVQFKRPVITENKNNGFAMNDRNILEAAWYKNINARLVYLELSLRVSHSDHQTMFNGHCISLSRGQYVTTENNLAKVIDGTKNQAAWALKVLEKNGVIRRTTIGKLNDKCTIITLKLAEKSQSPQQSRNNHAEPEKQRAVRAITIKEQSPQQSLHQEVSTTIKDIYVKDDNKNASALLVKEVVKIYNESFPELASVAKITAARKSRLLKIINDKFTFPNGTVGTFKTIDDWKELFAWIGQSDWLMGRVSGHWQMTFDFMVKPENFVKIIEGNYENKGGYSHD